MDMVKPMGPLHSSRLAAADIATVWPYTLTNPTLLHNDGTVITSQRFVFMDGRPCFFQLPPHGAPMSQIWSKIMSELFKMSRRVDRRSLVNR